MARVKKHKVLYILLSVFLLIIVGTGIFLIWLSHHYKQVITERLPAMVTNASDGIYHISFSDISISLYKHQVTITNLRLWPDTNQVNALRLRHHYAPNTTSTVFIPQLDAYGITWGDLASKRSLDCKNVVIHKIKWFIETIKHPDDPLLIKDKETTPAISRMTIARMDFINPDVTYHYVGPRNNYHCFLKGGTAQLNQCAFDHDVKMDTSVFLYATSGTIIPESFTFRKSGHRHYVKLPKIDFITGTKSITLKEVKINHLVDMEEKTGREVMIYNFNFPSVEFVDFNWKTLMNNDLLAASGVNASEPFMDVRFIRDNAPGDRNKMGHFPHQLIHEAIKTNIRILHIKNGRIKYTEPVKKSNKEAIITFEHINGNFSNITNIDSIIARHSSCIVKLKGKYMNKSDVSVTFNLSLADTTGRFKIDGFVKNLEGGEVAEQAAAFTLVKVTSFHLDSMGMHIEGDQTYGKGNFTVLYKDLKISLFKFDSKHRAGKRGVLSFLGSALLLYPANPMPNKEVRKVSTSFARDTTKGFIYLIWQNMYRAAKKTAVREQAIITLTSGPESGKDEQPKKGFFKRLFRKKNK